MKSSVGLFIVKVSCIAISLYAGIARAGFVEDFFDEAGAKSNITAAGIVESSALNVVTGGGYVYRSPRRDFVPFSITPPSLKSGCGGIDLFLGAFSIPSREEFVSFLRSVGTALPGLAFQLALQTMAPDLNEMVGRYADLIRSYSNRYTDSCSAAQALLEQTGAAEHIERMSLTAKNKLRSEGTVSDQSEADRRVKGNGGAVIEHAPEQKDSGGNVVDAPEINLTWSMLAGGRFSGKTGDDRALKETMMTLVGTTIFTQNGRGEDAVLTAAEFAPIELLPLLFGEEKITKKATRYRCDEPVRCLHIQRVEIDDINLASSMKKSASNYRNALIQRNPELVTEADLRMLTLYSSVPLLRVLNLASLSRYKGLANDLVNVYVEAAAYEALVGALDTLSSDVAISISSSSGTKISKEHKAHATLLQSRIEHIQSRLFEKQDLVLKQMVRASALVTQLEHIERSIKGNEAISLQRNLPSIETLGIQ